MNLIPLTRRSDEASVARLIDDAAPLGPVDRAWVVEALRRRDEVHAGIVEPVGADVAFREVRASLKNER